MVFDTREYIKSQEPPKFIAADGTEYVGRVLSLPQWQRFEPRVAAAKNHELDWSQIQRLIYDMCDAFFPATGPLWPYVIGRKRTVRWHLERLAPVGQMAAFWDFMRSQARATGVHLPELPGTPTMNLIRNGGASPASPIPTP